MVMSEIILIAHNIRSTHNVGSLFRTCEGFGVDKIILSGYTPYPAGLPDDRRLPHIVDKLTKQIHKTALGAEKIVSFTHMATPNFSELRMNGYHIVGLEQDPRSIMLTTYDPPAKIALLLGEEVEGVCMELRHECADLIEIPMKGSKESFNVSVAAGIALYSLQYNI